MDIHYIGALDIGGTKIAASVGGPEGPLARVVQATIKSGSPRAVPEQAIALLDAACHKAGIAPSLLQSVGVSSCGPFVRTDGNIFLSTPNICGGQKGSAALPNEWETIPLEQVLGERFERVKIENDCVAALVAERNFGAVQGEDNCAYATWSTGIGFGLCIDGNVLHGKHGNAGHGGHMLMSEVSTAQCGCGNTGDLEALISGRNVGAGTGRTAPELFEAARAGDEEGLRIASEAARWFGRGLYNITALLDLRVFVIGGSVWAHHGEWLQPMVLHEIESRFPALTEGVRIVPAALGGLVADIGAFSLAMPADWVLRWREEEPWRILAGLP